MTPLTPAAVMDEQRLQAVIDHANEIGDTAPTLAAYLCATVAEVRRLQQQSQEMAHELTQTARASQHFEQQVTALIAERDAALSERDKWRGVCVDVGRVIDALGKDIVDLPLLVLDVVKQRDAALAERDRARVGSDRAESAARENADRAKHYYAALTEARRVLREVQWMFDNGYDAEDACPLCHQPHSMGHTPTCALAAVLAQEEK